VNFAESMICVRRNVVDKHANFIEQGPIVSPPLIIFGRGCSLVPKEQE
jgi:hypothetical protein